jgi:CheY-like chemotaxis protein
MPRAGEAQVPGRFRQKAVVLLVEDNPDDVVMIREAFEQSLKPVQLYVVSNGEQAVGEWSVPP